MPADTSAQRKTPGAQVQPKIDDRLADAGTDFVQLAQSLTPDQARILTQLVAPLDRATVPLRIGFFTSRQSDRAVILEQIVRPAETRKVRTPEHHKVVGLRIDATVVPEGMLPWHYLVFSIIELLTESALLSERSTLSELRNEMNRLIRTYRREPASADQSAVIFAKRFQSLFPKLVTNTILLSNSVLVVVLDKIDDAEATDVLQWLEASQYFCNSPGCAVILAANETAVVAKLNIAGNNANGRDILSKWVSKRVEYSTQPATIERPGTMAAPLERRPVPVRESPTKGGSQSRLHQTDVPTAAATIIRDALQPDVNAIVYTTSQWRATMQALLRRTDEGLASSISGALVAKLVSLRAIAPELFNLARYEGTLLIALERAAHGDTSSQSYGEWGKQVGRHPRLLGLFTAEPEFSSMDQRELATALRLTNTSEEFTQREAAAQQEVPLQLRSNRPDRATGSSARKANGSLPIAETNFLLSQTFLATGGAGAAVFMIDRIGKLLVQAFTNPLAGGWIRAEVAMGTSTLMTLGVSLGAELIGLVLAVMIVIFWGAARKQVLHSVSLGLIIGSLASNLFDRIAYGNVLDYVHIEGIPGFNLAHLSLIAGAALLAYSVLRNIASPATESGE